MIIDGKAVAAIIEKKLKKQVDDIQGRKPCLAITIVGEDSASEIYVSSKQKKCANIGIQSIIYRFNANVSEQELIDHIEKLNNDNGVDGVLIQMPLPKHINETRICTAIALNKDVDGFHPYNVGKLFMGSDDAFCPCTPLGIKTLLEYYNIETNGKHVVIIGRSNIVGKPMASLMIQKKAFANATVTIAHSHTENIKEVCKQADILIVAIGIPKFITANMIREDAVIFDVGINRIEDASNEKGYRIVGDVDFDDVANKASYITPVPGGVGPMTVIMLMQNSIKSFYSNESDQ